MFSSETFVDDDIEASNFVNFYSRRGVLSDEFVISSGFYPRRFLFVFCSKSPAYTLFTFFIPNVRMVVEPTDVQFLLSGGAGNQNPFGSLGGIRSGTQLKDDMMDALFDPISINQRLTGHTDYYCIYIYNNSATSVMTGTRIWFTVVTSYISMGLGTSPVNGEEQAITPDTVPPAGITFVQPLSENNGIQVGNIPAKQHRAVWFRRIIPANAPPTGTVLTRFKIAAVNA